MKFIDANVFLRFLTNDDPAKAVGCRRLFRALAAEREEATTCEAIIAEVVYILGSRDGYGLSHDMIRDRLRPVIEARGLRLPQKAVYLHALEIFATRPRLDYPDALCVAHMQAEDVSVILSYDRDFGRVGGIERAEP